VAVHDPGESIIAGSPRSLTGRIAVSMLSSLLQQPAPPAASEPDAVSPATLMKENGRSRSASSWREADLSPIAVIHELMHGAHCRHASSVQRLGAKPILHTSSESLADFADHVDFELADGTMDYWSGCPHFAESGAPASPRCTFVPGSPRCAGSPRMPGSFARRRCGDRAAPRPGPATPQRGCPPAAPRPPSPGHGARPPSPGHGMFFSFDDGDATPRFPVFGAA